MTMWNANAYKISQYISCVLCHTEQKVMSLFSNAQNEMGVRGRLGNLQKYFFLFLATLSKIRKQIV
jgi:hypothetical protein